MPWKRAVVDERENSRRNFVGTKNERRSGWNVLKEKKRGRRRREELRRDSLIGEIFLIVGLNRRIVSIFISRATT